MNTLPYFLYHCPRLDKNVKIAQEEAVIDGKKYLIRHSCPNMRAGGEFKCDGLNPHGFACCRSAEEKQLIE